MALEMQITRRIFQSTLPVGEATGADADLKRQLSISIHASRGGSDRGRYRRRGGRYYFNPRFPWGKRLHPVGRYNLRRHFNPRFPWGKRRARQGETRIIKIFQSTLPVGEATNTDRPQFRAMLISIHASRGGSDAAGIDGEGGWRDIIEVQRANTPKSDRIKRDKEGVLCEGMIRDSRKRQ